MQSLFVRSGRPLRIYFDTKHIPPEAVPLLAWDIGRGGGTVSEDTARSDVLVVDPTFPRAFDEFLNARSAEQRPPVILAFWVPLCVLLQQLIWFGHPHWDCVVFPYERMAYPSIPTGILAYGSFLAGRNSQLVPPSELPARTPRLMAGAILDSSENAKRDPSPKLPPAVSTVDQPPSEVPATTAPAVPESGLPASDKPLPPLVSATEPSSETNDSSDPGIPVSSAPSISSARSTSLKRSGSGLRLATVGTSRVSKTPLSRFNRPPKSQNRLQQSSSLSELDDANAILDAESIEPSAQPQTSAAAPSGAKEPVVQSTMETTSGSLNDSDASATVPTGALMGFRTAISPPAPRETGPRRLVEASTGGKAAARTNGHLTGNMTPPTKSATDTPSSAHPAPPADTPTLSNPPEKTAVASISPPDGNPNTANLTPALSPRSLPVVDPAPNGAPPSDPQAGVAARTNGSPPNGSDSHTPKSTTIKDKVPVAQDPDGLTQTSVAGTLKSVPTGLSSSTFLPSAQPSVAPRLNSSKVNGVRFRSPVKTSQTSSEKPRSHSNGTAKPRPLITHSSGSTSSSLNSDQPPSPPLPEILPESSKSMQQWEKDDQYIIDYMNWIFEQDPKASATEIIFEIAKRLPHHSVEAWQRRFKSYEGTKFIHHVPVLNDRFHKRTSSVNPTGKSKSQAVAPARPSPPTPPAEPVGPPPPPTPPTYTAEQEGTKEWTDGEEQFLVDYMNWYFQQWPDAPTDDILIEIAALVPRHDRAAWLGHFRKREDMHYVPKVPELFRRMTNRTSRVNPSGRRGDRPTGAPPAMDAAQKRKRNEVDYTISSDEDEPKSWRNRGKGEGSSTARKLSRLKRPRSTM